MKFSMLLISLLLVSAGLCYAEDKSTNPQEQVDTAIAEAIRMLKAKDYEKFLDAFVAPDDLKVLKSGKHGKYEDVVKGFGGAKSAQLMEALEKASKMKPEMEAEGKIAKFAFTEEKTSGPNKGLVFVRIDKLWYIRN